MVPVLLKLGPITIYSFGAMMALAFLLAGYVVSIELRRSGNDPELAWSIVLWAAVGGIVGARLFYIFYDLYGFLDHPVGFLLTGSGFVWYGGLIGGFVSVTVLIRHNRLSWLRTTDSIAPALALGQVIGRIGCQVSGDGDWGKPTSLPWGVSYPQAVIGWHQWASAASLPDDVRVHPAPVYETLAYSAIFLVLWQLRRRDLSAGAIFWAYLMSSSVARFLVECVRVEPVIGAGMTQAQWISIALFLLGGVAVVLGRLRSTPSHG